MPNPNAGCITKKGASSVKKPKNKARRIDGFSIELYFVNKRKIIAKKIPIKLGIYLLCKFWK